MRVAVAALVPLALLAAVASALIARGHGHHAAAVPVARLPASSCARPALPFTGAIVAPPQSRSLAALAASGFRPRVVVSYAAFGDAFNLAQVDAAEHVHALSVVQLDPRHAALTAITSGHYDAYLRSYARAVRAWGCPIVLSFGHEMNGNWYPWGWKHTPAAVFVAAWRHIVTVFRSEHAANVTWMWTANRYGGDRRMSSPVPWWPGNAYVNWVGVDGYYYSADETFGFLFSRVLKVIRHLTDDPVVIAETGAAPSAGQAAKIAALFAGAKSARIAGVIYFDLSGHKDWALSGPALAAFRKAAGRYLG